MWSWPSPDPVLVVDVCAERSERVDMKLYGHPRAPEIRSAFARLFAKWPWTLYMTWTFRDRVGPVKALHEVSQHLRFVRWGLGGDAGWIVGLEQEYGADRPHAHGLVCAPRLLERVRRYAGDGEPRQSLLIEPYWRAWLDRNGAGRFELVRGPVTAVTFYCAKHAGERGELLISDNIEKFRPSRREADKSR